MSKPNLVFTGVTGYVGGAIVSAFLDHPNRANFNLTTLVRNADKVEKLKAFGLNPVVGNLKDTAFVEKQASEADYYISIADSDDLPAAKAVLEGLKKRYKATGVAPAFIHISGTGVIADDSKGEPSDVVWHDDDLDQMDTIDPAQLHRDVELLLINADKEGYVKTYLVSPATIWGRPENKLAKAGITNTHSQQVPGLIKVSLGRGAGGYGGAGKNVWNNTNLDDLADFYIKLFDHIRSNPNAVHGREGYYFVVNDEHNLKDVGKAIGQALYDLGKVKSPEATQITQAELDSTFQSFQRYITCNARGRGNRALTIGWKPTKTTKDFLAGIKAEAESIVASM